MKFRDLGLFLMALSAAFAQGVGGGNQATPAPVPQVRGAVARVSGSVTLPADRLLEPAVVGAAYSGEQIQEQVQTLSDGTHITQMHMNIKVYRDSQGRTRTERPLMMLPNAEGSPLLVEIADPVAGVRYTLDTQNKIAHRVMAQPPGSQGMIYRQGVNAARLDANGPGAAPPPPSPAPPGGIVVARQGQFHSHNYTEEKLPPQTIEGVLAEGTRRTTVVPEGTEGNDRPFVITEETWTSPDLKVTVLSKTDDPPRGETTMKLTNISRNEPDPGLFQPPPDYQVVDETGQFTVRYNQ
jgi:hypothetical protein